MSLFDYIHKSNEWHRAMDQCVIDLWITEQEIKRQAKRKARKMLKNKLRRKFLKERKR